MASYHINMINALSLQKKSMYKTREYLLERDVPICTSIINAILKSKCSNWTLLAGFYPPLTSHIEVSRGGIACPIAVGGDTLILPLVWLLAHLYLQGTWTDEE